MSEKTKTDSIKSKVLDSGDYFQIKNLANSPPHKRFNNSTARGTSSSRDLSNKYKSIPSDESFIADSARRLLRH